MRSSVASRVGNRTHALAGLPEYLKRVCAAAIIALAGSFAATSDAIALDRTDKANYKAAFKAAAKGNWTTARRHAQRARDPFPRKILTWLEMTQSGNIHDFTAISDFVGQNPDWPRLSRLRQRAEEAINESTTTQQVLSWFVKHPPQTSDGMIAYGQALIATGKTAEGDRLLRRAWIEGNFSRRSEVLFMRQYRKRFTNEDHWARLDRLLWDGRHREANRMLRRVSKGQQAVAIARMRLRQRSGGVDGAIARVPRKLKRDPGLLYERMRWRRKKGRDAEAMEILKNPPDRLVRPDLWARERVILARRLLAEGRVTDAYGAVRDHALDASHRARFAETEWMAGWISLRFLNEAGEAKTRFERLYDGVKYPVSRARAAYWAGRAAKAMKDEPAARDWYQRAALYPTTYHGQLAIAELGDKLILPPSPTQPTEKATREFHKHELVRVVRVLDELGQDEYLRSFVVRLSRLDDAPAHKVLSAQFATSIGRPDLGVWVARYAQRDRSAILTSIGYPLLEMPDGTPERALLLAVARQESNFNSQAISHAGARGVMQLMPATARRVARQHRLRYSRSRLTGDPTYNIRLGRRYLASMIKKFDGSYILAVAAYNAGPNAVLRWVKQHGDPRNGVDDPIDWIEMIPYRETRNYVQRVMGNLQIYRNRLEPGRVVMTLDRDLRR